MEEERLGGKQERLRKTQSDVLLSKSSASAALNEIDQPHQQLALPHRRALGRDGKSKMLQ